MCPAGSCKWVTPFDSDSNQSPEELADAAKAPTEPPVNISPKCEYGTMTAVDGEMLQTMTATQLQHL